MAEVPGIIERHHVKQYEDDVRFRAQQMVSKLRDLVLIKSPMGEETFMDQIGTSEALESNERAPASPHIPIEHFRRQISPTRIHWGHVIDELDKIKMLTDPQSRYQIAASSAIGRAYDDKIISAALGNAVVLNDNQTTTNVALPSTQKVGIQVGSAVGSPVDCNLNEEKIREAVSILEDNDVDLDDPINRPYGVMSPKAKKALMGQDKVASSDFNNKKPLVDGKLVHYMGIDWIVTTRLLSPAANQKQCFIWAKSGIGLGVYLDVMSRHWQRGDLSGADYIYTKTILGATRLEEEKVVEILIDESTTATGA